MGVEITKRSTLGHLSNALAAELDDATEWVARQVESRWKQNIVDVGAVDTGAFLNSPTVNNEGPMRRSVTSNIEYGPFIENGHHTRSGSFVPARPTMVPAAEATRPEFEAAITAAIERAAKL